MRLKKKDARVDMRALNKSEMVCGCVETEDDYLSETVVLSSIVNNAPTREEKEECRESK